MSKIALLGTMDTKGKEYAFLNECIKALGFETMLIDIGVLEPPIEVDIHSEEVAQAAGVDLSELRSGQDRGKAVSVMGEGAEKILLKLFGENQLSGVIAMGGSGGTSMACRAMRALPLGVPKVMISTMAGTNVSTYVGIKDIVMIPSIVDISGINKISREVLARSAGAVCGMAGARIPVGDDKPIVTASMFGNTTKAVEVAKRIVEEAGYEVLVFHSTGTGGRMMESLIDADMVSGVLDITTTEWADELAGGLFSAGPTRLSAAAKQGVPAIITPGCLDMVNFGSMDSVPQEYKNRLLYQHNPNVTLMRTTPEECRELGKKIAEILNTSIGPVSVIIPIKGISVISSTGQPFYWPEADEALFHSLREHLRKDIKVVELDFNINDSGFAEYCAVELLSLIKKA